MLPFGLLGGELPDPVGYGRRLEAAVSALAAAAGAPRELELERFRAARARLGVTSETSALLGVLGPAAAALGGALATVPVAYELVASYRGGSLARFGYMTYGPVRPSLALATGELLRGALTLLAEAGLLDDARLLAELFRLAYPSLPSLDEHASTTDVMLVGVLPDADALGLKVYFNTRLGRAGSHRERIAAMLARLGVEGLDAYDALYADGVAFQGVGVDLGAGSHGERVKLYVRVARTSLVPVLERLRGITDGDPLDAARFVEALDGPSLAGDVELALALRPGARPSLKATAFFDQELAAGPEIDAVGRLLERQGATDDALRSVLEAATGSRAGRAWAGALHGVGTELDVGTPKLNVYVQPRV